VAVWYHIWRLCRSGFCPEFKPFTSEKAGSVWKWPRRSRHEAILWCTKKSSV